MLLELIREYLSEEDIEYVSAISLRDCKIKKPYLLTKAGIEAEKASAIIFAVPYYVSGNEDRNISLYAISKDYHLYFSLLFGRLIPKLKKEYPGGIFVGFSDHSPIDEVHAAAAVGLGIVGKNHLLITEKYSSFVFIGCIITDVPCDTFYEEPKECENCGKCTSVCPCGLDNKKCISALSQKKGELSVCEANALISSGTVWGCDICQLSCPHSAKISETKNPFFLEKRISKLTKDIINNMSDEDFSARAYSWRGRNTILRNLELVENGDKNEQA